MVTEPLDWSPDAPHLYELRAVLRRGGEVADLVRERFGFRSIETHAGRIYLNGQPLFLRGALDQDYYPDGICTPPSEAFLEDQFRKAKALGLNCLRCHIKVPDPRYYAVADRVGLLIWTELPNAGRLTRAGARAGGSDTPRHSRARRQSPVHLLLDHPQRELGHRPRAQRRGSRLAPPHGGLAQGRRP